MKLSELDNLLSKTPVYLSLDSLVSLCYLDNITIFENRRDFWRKLDQLEPMKLCRYVILDDPDYRLPYVRLKHEPFTNNLNSILSKKYEEIQRLMLTQKDLSQEILFRSNAEIVVLILIDGLSFIDCLKYSPEPCIVNGITTTESGFTNIIYGRENRPLSFKLYDKGYIRRFGFTYWERENNELTNKLFKGFSDVVKVSSFEEVIKYIRSMELKPYTFLQIVRNGLDRYAHSMHDKPLKEQEIEQIFKDLSEFKEIFKSKGITANIFVTSDHGLLWKYEHEFKVIEPYNDSPRYIKGLHKIEGDSVISKLNEHYNTLLAYPYILRSFRNNEWGMHGGISFEESITPFIEYKVDK